AKAPANGIGIGETIRNIGSAGSWAALKNIEQCPAYGQLLMDLLEQLRPVIEARTGAMLKPQGFVFVTSPGGVTPYHFDPEHNILLQITGSKQMTMFPAGNPRFAPDETHESYHTGGPRDLFWRDDLLGKGKVWPLSPGEALYVPVMSPHFVQNGPAPSVSLSITWRSEWSFAEADARAFNSLLRKIGIRPRAPGRWPATNRAKAMGWRLYAKARGLR
ncbi:MAG: transcriptional regulator, partial [Novosphingobium meiothermophilum]